MALTGTFEDIGFAELLQLLNVGHKSGRLSVWRGADRAELYIRDGEVARACYLSQRGAEVVYRVLGWRVGEFRFEQSNTAWEREIYDSTEALILEGMKRFDEWEQVEAEAPDVQVVLRQRVSAVNSSYERLSDQARTVLRLVDARRSISEIVRESGLEPQEALGAVAELVAQEMVEQWAERSEVPVVLQAKGRLPEARGGIAFHEGSFAAEGSQLSSESGSDSRRGLKGGKRARA
jgi:hypothetical protein